MKIWMTPKEATQWEIPVNKIMGDI